MNQLGVEALVHVEDFQMDFGRNTVIRNLSFDIRAGETFGFLGSNGSGKTTVDTRWELGPNHPSDSPTGLCRLGGQPARQMWRQSIKRPSVPMLCHLGRRSATKKCRGG
jgi:ABC-2 type transport system ATP-binding protein